MGCRLFLKRSIVVILESVSSISDESKGLCCFCPELMLQGDDHAAFNLFFGLCRFFVYFIVLCRLTNQMLTKKSTLAMSIKRVDITQNLRSRLVRFGI